METLTTVDTSAARGLADERPDLPRMAALVHALADDLDTTRAAMDQMLARAKAAEAENAEWPRIATAKANELAACQAEVARLRDSERAMLEMDELAASDDGEGIAIRAWVWSELTDRGGEPGRDVERLDTGEVWSAPTLAAAIHAAYKAIADEPPPA